MRIGITISVVKRVADLIEHNDIAFTNKMNEWNTVEVILNYLVNTYTTSFTWDIE